MRVKCDLCGKRYTLDYNGAPCPKCGQKNYSMDMGGSLDVKSVASATRVEALSDHAKAHQQYDGGGHHVETPRAFSPHYTVNADNTSHNKIEKIKPPKRKKTFGDIFRTLITIAEVFFLLIIVVAMIFSTDEESEEITPEGEYSHEEIYCERYEPGFYEFQARNYDIGIIKLEDFYGEYAAKFDVPEGYELVSYVFLVDVPHGDYDYFSLWEVVDFYMVTTEGISVGPMNYGNMQSWLVEDNIGITNLITHHIYDKEGVISFLVKEGTADYLIIDTYKGQRSERSFDKRFIVME